MKRIVTVGFILILVAATFAGAAIWQSNKKPTISLNEAVKLATDTLNKDGGDFYCLGARVMSGQTDCDWYLDFSSTNGGNRWVEVGSDKKVAVRKDGPFSQD
jgi:hypothetical protein